jgi:predicted O-methyltransferase YrrM
MKRLARTLLGERLYGAVARRVMVRSIKAVVARAHRHPGGFSAEAAVDLLFSPAARYIRPWQHRLELLALARLIAQRRPGTIVEIGTASGGTLFLSALLADPAALIVSIDLQHGRYGGGYPDWRVPLYASFGRSGQRVELIRGDSHSATVRERLEALLGGRGIDYLFIDGDHSYDGVRQDFETYGRLLGDDAMVAFHDIVSDKSAVPDHFVSAYWDEIKGRYPHGEFIQDPGQSKLGLGVLFVRRSAATATGVPAGDAPAAGDRAHPG